MKGKWAQGIVPRHFAWVIKGRLAMSERPGGYGANHRRVRRMEEIIWLREQGFTKVVSLLPSPHNLHAYDELDVAWVHEPFAPHDDPAEALARIYGVLARLLDAGERILVHQEELADRVQGLMAGYLVHSGMVPQEHQAIVVLERIASRQLGPAGRELVAVAGELAGGARR